MSNPSDTMKKREELQSMGQQLEKTYNQDIPRMDTKRIKGVESEREPSTKRLGTGV